MEAVPNTGMSRVHVSAAMLYAVLDREFRAMRPAECTACHVPLPYWHEAPDEVSASWSFGTPVACRHGCHVLMAELLASLWTRYDLDAPGAKR
jgi:hypothetical protein